LVRPQIPNGKRTETFQQKLAEILVTVNARLEELHQLRNALIASAILVGRDGVEIERRNFQRLKDAIEGVMPHFAGLERIQARTFWHCFALALTLRLQAEWKAAGRNRLGQGPNSPLVRFVVAVIKHRIEPAPPPPQATVASVLRRRL
jgi:hypothetical protein